MNYIYSNAFPSPNNDHDLIIKWPKVVIVDLFIYLVVNVQTIKCQFSQTYIYIKVNFTLIHNLFDRIYLINNISNPLIH